MKIQKGFTQHHFHKVIMSMLKIFNSRSKKKAKLRLLSESGAGFTLIETLVYIALFTIIIGGGMVAVYQIIESTNASYNHVILQEEANFLFRKINWALTGAVTVNVTSGTNPFDTLTVSKPGLSLIFTRDSGNNSLTLKKSTGPVIELNSGSISVLHLTFEDIPPSNGMLQGMTTNFTLETAQNGRPASQIFSTTKYLRPTTN